MTTDHDAIQRLRVVYRKLSVSTINELRRSYPDLVSALEDLVAPALPSSEQLADVLPLLKPHPNTPAAGLYPEAIETPPPEKLKDVIGQGEAPPEPRIATTDEEMDAELMRLRAESDAQTPGSPGYVD